MPACFMTTAKTYAWNVTPLRLQLVTTSKRRQIVLTWANLVHIRSQSFFSLVIRVPCENLTIVYTSVGNASLGVILVKSYQAWRIDDDHVSLLIKILHSVNLLFYFC